MIAAYHKLMQETKDYMLEWQLAKVIGKAWLNLTQI
jgi:hypothetical protein